MTPEQEREHIARLRDCYGSAAKFRRMCIRKRKPSDKVQAQADRASARAEARYEARDAEWQARAMAIREEARERYRVGGLTARECDQAIERRLRGDGTNQRTP